ncbi:ModD protein [Serratia sp. L9]|uniref:ModD protein n=1 Tax=Serratia sp. L9 TaxID=3423946 RepID=UPI003D671811
MIFIPDSLLDQWLMDDIQGGDLTTRALGIGSRQGVMSFHHRHGGCVSGQNTAQRMLMRLGLEVEQYLDDGDVALAGQVLLTAKGRADALHQGWKAVQNLLEWSCGVSDYLYRMRQILQQYSPNGKIACTRKTVPGTHLLALQAVIAAGGIIHRTGCSETLLLFANHRKFCSCPDDWQSMVTTLRQQAPEKAIIVEADTVDEARLAIQAQPDIVQLDKFSAPDILLLKSYAETIAPGCRLSVAGGINLDTIEEYARTGVALLVTSAPYHASPSDIKVRLIPTD